jgi:hypothetical protein
MSESTPAAPAPVAVPTSDTIGHFFTAIKLSAASVYHQVLRVEADVSKWINAPDVKPLVSDAVTFFETVLTSHGIPVPALEVAGKAVFAALAQMAADDTTVKSGAANAP